MLASESELITIRQQLERIYRQLTQVKKQIVRLFSVIYEPVTRTAFLKCIDAVDEKQDNGSAFNSKTLKPHLEYLLEQKLLIQEPGKSPQCNPLLAEIATRDAIEAGVWEKMVGVIEANLPIPTYYGNQEARKYSSIQQLIREIRIGIYRQDLKFVFQQLESYQTFGYNRELIFLDEIFELLFNNPFDRYWFNKLPQELYEVGLASMLVNSVMDLSNVEGQFELLKAEANNPDGRCSDNLRLLLTEQFI